MGMSTEYCTKTEIGKHGHNDGGPQDAKNGGKKALFGVETEYRGNQRSCPCACSGQRNTNKECHTPIRVFFDGPLMFFDFAVKPRRGVCKKLDAALSHPFQNRANEQEDERHGQNVACNAEECGLPPRHTESPTERNGSAALDDGEH